MRLNSGEEINELKINEGVKIKLEEWQLEVNVKRNETN